ncbi:MAG TPA: deoxyribonuclease V [candidate division Zixibacteria bacterium]|mgnify:CR=1 FL=1|nr:deoxyribonuclease V [candidate division Zixibacteria bacterium]
MKINRLHDFNVDVDEARAIQEELASMVIVREEGEPPNIADIRTIAGCDVAFDANTETAFGALVLMSFPNLEVIETITATSPLTFPYIPGFLSFREMIVLLELFEKLRRPPDVVLVDGQGIAHPRGLGLASHLGLFLDIPTVGCAKSRLLGKHGEVGTSKGGWTPLIHKSREVGRVLRTRDNVRPIFVSPGHLVSIRSSAEIAIVCARKYRIPEPTRNADIEVARFKRETVRHGE